ncbi:hypothetical protein ABJI51_04650 [Amycolatopsis sp. NEAU-NG30]|uniref:Uncharacterized protein n=1 Tax=Amycolatopsis melonis TaxID=3156488 RepID=A0ABV0L7R3_9PSEU
MNDSFLSSDEVNDSFMTFGGRREPESPQHPPPPAGFRQSPVVPLY